MKSFILTILLTLSSTVYAHDEGHGPKLGDQPKYGGTVAAVINKEDVNKGTDAKMLYKAELTKTNDNVVRVYLYDEKMTPTKVESVSDITGELQFKDPKTKKWTSQEFKLSKKGDHFEGKLPTKPRRPFNVDVTVATDKNNLFMAFDNLN